MSSNATRYNKKSAASLALKKCLRFFMAAALAVAAVSYGIAQLFTEDVVIRTQESAQQQLAQLWKSYQYFYIENGRVVRPMNEYDTVSEGQAYAMLRACWQNDRETFDSVYRWSEENLSRLKTQGDHLLSWRYGATRLGSNDVLDQNPALDADLDYALALFIASKMWPDSRPPAGLPPYREKATAVCESIMAKAVYLHPTGELVLLPWPLAGSRDQDRDILLNPSYFSPGHYRVFEQETGNRRWGKLADDTYVQISRLLQPADRVVTVPDWILMRADGTYAVDPSRGHVSSYDAFRLWWRLRVDYELSGNFLARQLIENKLVPFINKSMDLSGGDVAAASDVNGEPISKDPNTAMTAVYRWAIRDIAPSLGRVMQRQALHHLHADGEHYYFQSPENYYANSWAWFSMLEGDLNFPFARFWGSNQEKAATRERETKR